MKLASTASSLMVKLRFCAPLHVMVKTIFPPVTNHIPFVRHLQLTTNSNTSSGHFDDDNELDIAREGRTDEFDTFEDVFSQTSCIRNLLYPDTKDSLLVTLNKCASVQELLYTIETHKPQLKCEHVTQAVLILWDLQRAFNHFSFINSTFDVQNLDKLNNDYLDKLRENATFVYVLSFVNSRLDKFDLLQLSSILLYLSNMGFSVKHEVLQRLIEHFKVGLRSNKGECLMSLSHFIACTSRLKDLSYYYHVQDVVPIVFDYISKVKSAKEFSLLTVCLNGLRHFITEEILSVYKMKASDLTEKKEITGKDFGTVLKAASFLCYNEWKDANTVFISEQIMLLKSHVHLMNVQDLLTLYEVIYKTHEPGDILNEAQRCASKFFLQLEEEATPMRVHLKLLLCLSSFASPTRRLHVEKFLRKYIDYDLSPLSVFHLYKVILYNKTADAWIYQTYWKKTLSCLKDESFRKVNLLKACNNYIKFNQDVTLHRCGEFESQVLDWLEAEIEDGGVDTLMTSRFSMIASFVLIYGRKKEVIRRCIEKIEDNIEQFNHIDCYNLSRSLEIATEFSKNGQLSADVAEKFRALLDRCTFKSLRKGLDFNARSLLFKGYIYRCSSDEELLRSICSGYDEHQNVSSLLIRNICFCLHSTSILLPNIIDKMVDYVVQHKEHVLAFNAERLIYLCYCLGYVPKNCEQFLQVTINIILRDQERLNGLSYLHTCLSLCYFNALPQSLIRHIFNVEFMEKLDAELLNCYFKDTYPVQVRRNMFYLNRAVCLDYPECNVPWFHRKYVDTIENKNKRRSNTKGFLEYLVKLSGSEKCITQNEVTPYGYNIDFVFHLNERNEFVTCDRAVQKIGVLLMQPQAYTKISAQLKGKHQLKIRHLEMLGYKIIAVNFAEWKSLIYGEAKINYLSNLIWPQELINKDSNR